MMMNVYDPFMDNLEMIIDGHDQQPAVFFNNNINILTNNNNVITMGDDPLTHWPYILKTHCSTSFLSVSTPPVECTQYADGIYNLRWHKELRAMKNIYLHINEKTRLYEVTGIFTGSETVKICPSNTALVVYLNQQISLL